MGNQWCCCILMFLLLFLDRIRACSRRQAKMVGVSLLPRETWLIYQKACFVFRKFVLNLPLSKVFCLFPSALWALWLKGWILSVPIVQGMVAWGLPNNVDQTRSQAKITRGFQPWLCPVSIYYLKTLPRLNALFRVRVPLPPLENFISTKCLTRSARSRKVPTLFRLFFFSDLRPYSTPFSKSLHLYCLWAFWLFVDVPLPSHCSDSLPPHGLPNHDYSVQAHQQTQLCFWIQVHSSA